MKDPKIYLKLSKRVLPLVTLAAATLVLGCGTPDSEPSTSSPAPPPTAPPPVEHPQGIDVSSHVGAVDWAAVASQGHQFAFAKATEGKDLADPAFADHWPAMKEAGLLRGAYHFYVTEDDPEAQASFFIETVTLEPGDLAPVVDVELIGHGTGPGLPERLRTFLDRLESHYGVKPIIYTSPNFWDEHMSDAFGEYPLWVAEYGVDEPHLPAGWSRWHLWQWQEDAAVDGVEKGADLSRVPASGPGLAELLVP